MEITSSLLDSWRVWSFSTEYKYHPSTATIFDGENQTGIEEELHSEKSHIARFYKECRSVRLRQDELFDSHLVLFDGIPFVSRQPYVGDTHVKSLVTEYFHYTKDPTYNAPRTWGSYSGRWLQFFMPKGNANLTLDKDVLQIGIASALRWNGPEAIMGYRVPSSAMLIKTRKRPEFRLFSQSFFGLIWNNLMEWLTAEQPISISPVRLAWLPHPLAGQNQLFEESQYIVVHQRFQVPTLSRSVPCCLNAYLEPVIEDGKFFIAYRSADHFVEPGWEGHYVDYVIRNAVLGVWKGLWSSATSIFNFFADIPAESVAILPGAQERRINAPGGGLNQGDYSDGFTLCVTPPATRQAIEAVKTETEIIQDLQNLANGLRDVVSKLFSTTLVAPVIVSGNGNVTEVTVQQWVDTCQSKKGIEADV